eukprot:PhM_4_TR4275/c0_g4_i1/m.67887
MFPFLLVSPSDGLVYEADRFAPPGTSPSTATPRERVFPARTTNTDSECYVFAMPVNAARARDVILEKVPPSVFVLVGRAGDKFNSHLHLRGFEQCYQHPQSPSFASYEDWVSACRRQDPPRCPICDHPVPWSSLRRDLVSSFNTQKAIECLEQVQFNTTTAAVVKTTEALVGTSINLTKLKRMYSDCVSHLFEAVKANEGASGNVGLLHTASEVFHAGLIAGIDIPLALPAFLRNVCVEFGWRDDDDDDDNNADNKNIVLIPKNYVFYVRDFLLRCQTLTTCTTNVTSSPPISVVLLNPSTIASSSSVMAMTASSDESIAYHIVAVSSSNVVLSPLSRNELFSNVFGYSNHANKKCSDAVTLLEVPPSTLVVPLAGHWDNDLLLGRIFTRTGFA